MKNLTHIATRVFETPLLIRPSKLSVILDVLGPRMGLGPVKIEGMWDDDEDDDVPPPNDSKPYQVTDDGIACIGICGTLVKTAGWLDAMSGMVSYAKISSQFRDAINDQAIKGVMLCMDTPGGEVSGLYDLVDEIYSARGTKPIYAVADDSAFSAGYAIASAADKVYVTRTGGVGSIGVIAVHVDQSKMDEMRGLKYTAVYAGAHKNDFSSHEPLSDDAKESLQAEIDRCYDMFAASVSRNRNMAEALVRKTEAKCFWGETALSAGLADRVGNCDDALGDMRQAITQRRQTRVAASAETQIPNVQGERSMEENNQTADANTQTATATQTETQTQSTAVDAEAMRANIAAEQEEIIDLCALVGDESFALTAIKDKMSLGAVRAALKARKAAAQKTSPTDNTNTGTVGNSAESQLNQLANQLATKNGITFAQAYVQVLNQNPALYNQYVAEKAAQAKR